MEGQERSLPHRYKDQLTTLLLSTSVPNSIFSSAAYDTSVPAAFTSASKDTVCHKTALWPKRWIWCPKIHVVTSASSLHALTALSSTSACSSRSSTGDQRSRDWVQLRSSYFYIRAPSSAQLSSDLEVAGVTVTKNKSRVNQLQVLANNVSYCFCSLWGPRVADTVSSAPLTVTEDPLQEVQGAGKQAPLL